MKKYRVSLKSKWISLQRPRKIEYDVFALNETKAILQAIQFNKEKFGELDYYEDYYIENIVCLTL